MNRPGALGRLDAAVRGHAERLRGDSLARNSAMIAAATATTSVLGYAYWVLAARLFPVESVGVASAVVSAMSLVSTVAIVGGQSALVQRLPGRTTAREWSGTVTCLMALGVLTSVLGGALTVAVLLRQGGGQQLFGDAVMTTLFLVAVPATTAATLAEFMWIAERRAAVMLGFSTAFAAGKLLLLVALQQATQDPVAIVGAWTIACVVSTAASLVAANRLHGLRPVFAGWRQELRELRRSLAGHHVINLAIVAPTLVLPVIAAIRMGAAEAAYLYAAWRIGGFFVLVASALGSALFAEGSHRPDDIAVRARSAMRLLLPGLVLVVGGVVLLRGPVLGLFGPQYREHAATALLLLALAAVPEAALSVGSAVLRVQRRLAAAAAILVGVAGVEIVVVAWLMPVYGVTGSAAIALATQVAGCAVMAGCLLRRGGGTPSAGTTPPGTSTVPPGTDRLERGCVVVDH